MPTYVYAIEKNPSDEFSLRNRAVVRDKTSDYAKVNVPGNVQECYLTLASSPKIAAGKLGLSGTQREWLNVRLNQPVQLKQCDIPRQQYLIGAISVEVDFFQKPKKAQPAVNTDEMATYFLEQFNGNIFAVGQPFLVGFIKGVCIKATILQIAAEQMGVVGKAASSTKKASFGIIHANTRVIFEKKADSIIRLIGCHVRDSAHEALISPDWDFNKIVIEGLDEDFFRRYFASRRFPPYVVDALGMRHICGILLFGRPGTGKTLVARQIGKMLHAREPKVVNGPEILNKCVGESEANMGFFAEAEAEQKMSTAGALHIIIFDEIDAICLTRGSSTGVHDTVVNQLLAKMKQLNNILVIGMTNRKDMIDEALLEPGGLEVQLEIGEIGEIGLPDVTGPVKILHIHTLWMEKNNKSGGDVDMGDLAKEVQSFRTELEAAVPSAQATDKNKKNKLGGDVDVDKKMQNIRTEPEGAMRTAQATDKNLFNKKNKLGGDVDVDDLAKKMQNIRTEPEGAVCIAQATDKNKLDKAKEADGLKAIDVYNGTVDHAGDAAQVGDAEAAQAGDAAQTGDDDQAGDATQAVRCCSGALGSGWRC